MFKYFVIPYSYFLKTRLKGNTQRVSWFFVYFAPTIFIYFDLVGYSFNFNNLIYIATTLLIVNYVYENGYIQNDVLTIKNETNPTYRLNQVEIHFAQKNIFKILVYRFIVTLILFFSLFLTTSHAIYLLFLVLAAILQIVFIIYNSVRNRLNLYLIIPLSYIRFYGPVIPLLLLKNDYISLFLLLLVYPVIKALEFTKQPRYELGRISMLIGKIDRFRVIYYLLLTLLMLFLFIAINLEILPILLVSVYYLLYRLFGLVLINRNKKFNELVKSGAKKEYRT